MNEIILICNQARWAKDGQIAEMIIDAVNHIDVSKYKESMSPLIKKDIYELMKVLG